MKSADQNELPEGWSLVEFKELIQSSLNGYGKRKQDTGEPSIVLRLADILEQEVSLKSPRRVNSTVGEVEKYRLKPDDLLVIRVNGSPDLVGRLIHFTSAAEPVLFCDHFIRVRLVPGVIAQLVRLYADSPAFRWHVETTKVSSAGQNTISQGALERARIPLPPLREQQRIVAKVEALLARVDVARQRLAKVPAILKRFRQSVLAAGCSGHLTADWREEQPKLASAADLLAQPNAKGSPGRRAGRLWGAGEIPELSEEERTSLPESWVWAKVRDLGDDPSEAVQVGPMSMQSRDFADKGVPVLNVGCVQWGHFDESKLDHMPEEKAVQFARYRIGAGDILFTRSGTIGRCAVAGKCQEGYLMTFHLLRARPTARKVLSRYLLFVFQGARHIRRQMEDAAIGSTRPGFNTNLLGGLDVPLPSLPEQHEIVRRVEALFQVADAIEKRLAAATARAEKLTQAILAKAFRGELVPTEAELARREGRDYEPASVLLERIREKGAQDNANSKQPSGKANVRRRAQGTGPAATRD